MMLEEDSLVSFFANKGFSESTIREVEQLEEIIKCFIYQKQVFDGRYRFTNKKPLWEVYK